MKKLFYFSALIALLFLSACVQKLSEADVPASVKASFNKQYPGVTAKWEKENSAYEVNFEENGKNMSAVYNADGTLAESEVSVPESDLPAAAKSYLAKNFAGKKIKEVAKITKADGSVNYEAEVGGADQIFDQNGNFLKTAKD